MSICKLIQCLFNGFRSCWCSSIFEADPRGGAQLDKRFIVASLDTLRAAQKEPKKYRDLTAKVAGYNAFFTLLSKEYQDNIITRTEHGL